MTERSRHAFLATALGIPSKDDLSILNGLPELSTALGQELAHGLLNADRLRELDGFLNGADDPEYDPRIRAYLSALRDVTRAIVTAQAISPNDPVTPGLH